MKNRVAIHTHKSLFLYYDPDFNVNFGHYTTIFQNIYENYQMFFNFMTLFVKNPDKNTINMLDGLDKNTFEYTSNIYKYFIDNIKDYNIGRIIIYVYKGTPIVFEQIKKLQWFLQELDVTHKVYFCIFDNKLEPHIVKHQQNVMCCTDIESISKSYHIHYIPPPLIHDSETIFKGYSSKLRVILNVYCLNLMNHERFDNINESLINRISSNKNIQLYLKVVRITHNINNSNVTVLQHMNDLRYKKLLNMMNVVVLPYRPVYYKTRSSGVFIECIKRGCAVVVCSGTTVGEYVSKFGIGELYTFGNNNDLISKLNKVVQNYELYRENHIKNKDEIKDYLDKWTTHNFFYKTASNV